VKDFSYTFPFSKRSALARAQVLDYGASWGYATCGSGRRASSLAAVGPRAEFGRRLGLEIHNQLPDCRNCYDAVYSCHVLEHVPDPLALITRMLEWVKPGGLVVAHTPNGSLQWRQSNREGFHSTWGRVHPFLLSDEFVVRNFGHLPCYVSSDDRPELVGAWDRQSRCIGDMKGDGLFFALIRACW
jgi:SAM-dependent methyltransferase